MPHASHQIAIMKDYIYGQIFYLVLMLLYFGEKINATQNFYYERGAVETLSSCPGQYCGRTYLENGSWSGCGSCDRGLRRNASSACEVCVDQPSFYDWLYLGFMALLPLIIHLCLIDISGRRQQFTNEIAILNAVAFIEVTLAAIISLLIFEPRGSLYINSCQVNQLSDWYPLFHNPNPNYEGSLSCTQEAVYPLYSIVFVFYTLCLVIMLVFRSWLSSKLLPDRGQSSIYHAMYALPSLVFAHALFGGLLYYSFPYLVIILSVISNAAYFAFQLNQDMLKLFVGTVCDSRKLMILTGHWFLHAYGIVAVTEWAYPSLVALVPLPSLFYILTSRFSDPAQFTGQI